jgi:putative nucleotidyltransferase with HDIG domain
MAACNQDAQWHAEGDVWTHTKMVCAELEQLADWPSLDRTAQLKLLFTALFHDSGKPATTVLEPETGRTRSPKHALVGAEIARRVDGRVTKQYFLAGELGTTFLNLIAEIAPDQPVKVRRRGADCEYPLPGTKIGGPEARSILGRMLGDNEVEVTYVPDFEVLSGAAIVDLPGNAPPAVRGAPLPVDINAAPTVALVLVTGQPSALAAFEAALDLFYTSIPQIEITVLVVEYQVADALAFGVTGIDAGSATPTPVLENMSSRQLVRSYTSVFPLRQPIVGSSPVTNVGLFTLGGIHNSWELNMVLEALEANNLADIQSAPKLVVRSGGVASISTLTQFPFPKAKINQLGTEVATDIEFKPVGVKMNIVPVIAGTDSVILQVYADVSAVTSFADTTPVATPITSTRTAVTTVYLKDGHTLVIGGLKSETKFESETKVPILGDIPILGFLFRSTSTSRNETTVEFHITPRIVTDRGAPPQSRPR